MAVEKPRPSRAAIGRTEGLVLRLPAVSMQGGKLTGWTTKPFRPDSSTGRIPPPTHVFYSWPRLVTHIDDQAIALVGALYDELGITGEVLDLMGSWVSHFRTRRPDSRSSGMNAEELAANPLAAATVVHDLNADPRLPFDDESFDAWCAACRSTTSPGPSRSSGTWPGWSGPEGPVRAPSPTDAFPPKPSAAGCRPPTNSIASWSGPTFELAGGWDEPHSERRTPPFYPGDPLFAVWVAAARPGTRSGPQRRAPDEPWSKA